SNLKRCSRPFVYFSSPRPDSTRFERPSDPTSSVADPIAARMPHSESYAQPYVSTIELEGRRYMVTCRVSFDGIEYLGRLWFADEATGETGMPDRAPIPGRTRDEVLELARRLSPGDLALRHRRALAEKRRFLKLRRATEDILTKIRYL